MEVSQHQPQLYLVTRATSEALASLSVLAGELDIAALLIHPAGNQPRDDAITQDLIGLAQRHGIAALIENDAALALRLGCDGVHLDWTNNLRTRFDEARQHLGPEAIIGIAAGKSRHDAMSLSEAGASYVSFGIPANVKDRDSGRERRDTLVAWWAEIFETPCVAFDTETPAEADDLARLGVDFIGMHLPANAAGQGMIANLKAMTPQVPAPWPPPVKSGQGG